MTMLEPSQLPVELFRDILADRPMSDLAAFALVSKSWYAQVVVGMETGLDMSVVLLPERHKNESGVYYSVPPHLNNETIQEWKDKLTENRRRYKAHLEGFDYLVEASGVYIPEE